MKNKRVSVVIANWNGKKWLDKCLNTLFYQDYDNLEVIIVDNNSTDGSVDFIKDNYNKVIIIENKKNLGFGVANNIGVKRSTGEVLFFLNNDTECFPDTISKLMSFNANSNFNILSPKILNQDRQALPDGQYSSGMDFLGTPIGPTSKLFYVEGCSMMIGRKDFDYLGGFDENYFMYSEDIDLCWRAYLYGMKVGICDESRIIHFGGGSSEKTRYEEGVMHTIPFFRRYEVEKNNLRNILKNYRLFNLIWVIPLFLFQELLEVCLYLFTGNYKMIKIVLSAIYWNVINIDNTLKERKSIQRKRKEGDWCIFLKMNFGINKIRIFLKIGMPKFK